jgi:hypothetical protein
MVISLLLPYWVQHKLCELYYDVLELTLDLFLCPFNHCSWEGGVRLNPLGMSVTIWPIVTSPDEGWWWMWSSWSNDWQQKPKYSDKTCPSATFSATNPTWSDLGSNLGSHCGKPATNHLSCGTALIFVSTVRTIISMPPLQNAVSPTTTIGERHSSSCIRSAVVWLMAFCSGGALMIIRTVL